MNSISVPKMICEAFGYKKMLLPKEEAKHKKMGSFVGPFKLSQKDADLIEVIEDNKDSNCMYCGNNHNKGYSSKKDMKHLASAMISPTYNEIYSFASKDNFICEYCGFASISYSSPSKSAYGLKMVNVLITNNLEVVEKDFRSGKDNELFEIIKNPPEPPFIVLINSRGTVLENMVFKAKASISKDWITVNYGLTSLEVCPDEVFECLADANSLSTEFDIEPNSDIIFNRADEVSFKLGRFQYNQEFMASVANFISKYDRDCRIVAKMIQQVYLKTNKPEKKKKIISGAKKVETTIDSLFDF
jgi:hypothetical protein